MAIHATIKHDEEPGTGKVLEVTVVTVGHLDEREQRHLLAPQESVTLQVHHGQFVMVDEADSKEGE